MDDDFMFQKSTLANGLRIMTVSIPHSPSVTAMVLVGVGSRHEADNAAGISHFIEHNVFKGTKSRPRRNQISAEIEGLGGITNAATSHEYTFYWAKAAAAQAGKILDVVMDVSLNMTFPKKDLEIERGNVVEEINLYQDTPMQRIVKDFIQFIWGDHPVGRSILGTKQTVGSFTREQMLRFVKKNYQPARMAVVAAGAINQNAIRSQVKEYYRSFTAGPDQGMIKNKFEEFQVKPQVLLDSHKTQQTHLCLGVKTFGRLDSRRYALDLVNAILGQGMSSRLWQKIRDELGLAYYVGSVAYELEDTGVWFVRAGVDTKRAEQAIKAILGELKKLTQDKVATGELRKVKEYIKGKTLLGTETSDDLGGWYGFQELLEKEVISPQEYNCRIEAVSADDIQALAQQLIKTEKLNLGLTGPFNKKDRFESLLQS